VVRATKESVGDKLNHRDRAFLQDMVNFIYLNHVVTAFSLAEGINNAPMIAARAIRGIHGQPHELIESSHQEALVNELSEKRIASVQSIMIARVFAELISAYENLGAFGWAIKKRKTDGRGIFSWYTETRDGGYAQFYQRVINRIENRRPTDPPVTLGDLLKLPPISDLQGHFPQELIRKLEQDYLERPKFLYDIAKIYEGKIGNFWQVRTMPPAVPVVNQEISSAESYIHIIADIIPVGSPPPQSKITTEIYNKIKHVFLVTENVEAYADQANPIQLVFASLKRDPAVVQDWINGIKSVAGVMNDIASLLILLDHFGIPL
jgi:hypothetical protein